MHYVVEATYVSDYRIKMRFDDAQVKVVDLASHLDGPIFEPLKDLAYFPRFTVNEDIDTVTWPNGADFSPDFLYEIGIDLSEKTAAHEVESAVREP